jgi:hypothetical protein
METEMMMTPTSTETVLKKERTAGCFRSEPWAGDAPGTYDIRRLRQLLLDYLTRTTAASRWIRHVLLPACLKNEVLSIMQFRKAFVNFDPNCDEQKVRHYMTHVSTALGKETNDFLRQVIEYEYPHNHWKKDNFSIKSQYRQMVMEVLERLKDSESHPSAYRKETFGIDGRSICPCSTR